MLLLNGKIIRYIYDNWISYGPLYDDLLLYHSVLFNVRFISHAHNDVQCTLMKFKIQSLLKQYTVSQVDKIHLKKHFLYDSSLLYESYDVDSIIFTINSFSIKVIKFYSK